MATKSTTTVLFDDQCGKCTRWADFIKKRDPGSRVKLVGQNSEQGKEILLDIPKEMEGLDSIFLISNDGRWFPKSAAIWRVCRQLAFPMVFSINNVSRTLANSGLLLRCLCKNEKVVSDRWVHGAPTSGGIIE